MDSLAKYRNAPHFEGRIPARVLSWAHKSKRKVWSGYGKTSGWHSFVD
jgi:hypothetical protein